jgi:hypothetical protein
LAVGVGVTVGDVSSISLLAEARIVGSWSGKSAGVEIGSISLLEEKFVCDVDRRISDEPPVVNSSPFTQTMPGVGACFAAAFHRINPTTAIT